MPIQNRTLKMEKVTVGLGERAYDILIAPGIREQLAKLEGDHFLMVDTNVSALYGEWAIRAIRPRVKYVFTAGEAEKTPETVIAACRMAAEARLDRHARFVALGGGVTGDMTGFAAAIYMRGVKFIQIPTTLLAMVDSSVGGKTGVDIPEGKNLIGAFHQPEQVLIDTDFLKTLPVKEIRCGLAEIVKTGVILDEPLFQLLEAEPELLVEKIDLARYAKIIRRCCERKAEVVAADERESGIRAILNYGHTFGHAFELLSNFEISHGEGVALGMCAAAEYAVNETLWSREEANRQKNLLEKIGLPTRLPRTYTPDAIIRAMGRDKKNSGGAINLVLPVRIGEARVCCNASAEKITAALEAIYE